LLSFATQIVIVPPNVFDPGEPLLGRLGIDPCRCSKPFPGNQPPHSLAIVSSPPMSADDFVPAQE
jgi:hypothetical protein